MPWLGDAWKWVQDSGGALTALATIATALFAVWALVNASRDSRDRSRPMVIAEMQHAEHNDSAVVLAVRNAGASMARRVEVTFDPDLGAAPYADDSLTQAIVLRYASPLSGMAPGQVFRNVWWSGHSVPGMTDLQNAVATPDRVTVALRYEDDRGRVYTETYALDVRDLLRETFSESSSSFKGRLKTIDESLKTMSKSVDSVARTAQSAERRASAADDD